MIRKVKSKKTVKKTTKSKKTVPKPKKTSEKAKTIIKMTPSSKKTPVVEEADTPENSKVAGWKTGVATKKAFLRRPKILRPKKELWGKLKEVKRKKKRINGIFVFVDGLEKTGKTNISLSAVKFKGFNGKRRILPPGKPVYVLDTENASEDEADFNFPDYIDEGDILIKNCFVENPLTKEIDPTKSLDLLEEWAYSLTDEKVGTLVIDNFTDYCDWVYYKLVDVVLGIGFTADGKPKRNPMPIEYQWRNKKIKDFLRRLRNIPLNVILIAQVKEEWGNTGGGPMDGYRTGGYESNVLKGTKYWVDVIARYEKIAEDNGKVTRKLVIKDSRFETKDMAGREYTLKGDPTFQGIIDLIKDLI